mmetsp:Transcript_148887/g.478307  ORF Transcript_148887/g.478307 Transcript_148887/m.478307 type:complete len:222 (+) Transcript_148887:58-723(+)
MPAVFHLYGQHAPCESCIALTRTCSIGQPFSKDRTTPSADPGCTYATLGRQHPAPTCGVLRPSEIVVTISRSWPCRARGAALSRQRTRTTASSLNAWKANNAAKRGASSGPSNAPKSRPWQQHTLSSSSASSGRKSPVQSLLRKPKKPLGVMLCHASEASKCAEGNHCNARTGSNIFLLADGSPAFPSASPAPCLRKLASSTNAGPSINSNARASCKDWRI